MKQLSIGKDSNIKKKILGMFVLIVILAMFLIFVLYKNNVLFSESVDYELAGNMQNEDVINNNIIKNNDQERKDDLFEIELALEKYYDENNSYPVSENSIRLDDENSQIYKVLIKYALDDNFQDPNDYYYEYRSDGSYFELSARLDDSDDENCEMMNENICIYKKRTYGRIAKILTQNEKNSIFLEKIISIDTDDNTMIVTGNYLNDNDQKIVDMLDSPENIKIKKEKEIIEIERKINNLILIGNADSNDLIFNVYRKRMVIENFNLVDENNLYIATLKNSQSPWNNEKDIFIVETGCLNDEIIKEMGKISVEKIGEDGYHMFLSTDNDKFTLVESSKYRATQPFLEYALELGGKNVEVYGYKKVCDFEKIILTDSIAVININEIK